MFVHKLKMNSLRTWFGVRAQATDFAAVNLYGDRIEVARVRRDRGARPVVEVCAHVESRGDQADALQRLRREWHLERCPCATTLNGGQYQMQMVDSPNVPEAELKSAVRWKLKEFLDYPLESATVDVVQIPADAGSTAKGRSVYAVAARNADIESRMKLFTAAKIPLRVIDIPEMAQRNIAALMETDHRALALLSFGEDGGLLTFSARGELYLARRIDVGREQLTRSAADARNQLFERIALELQRSLDHFDRQYSNVPVARLLIGPLPEDIGLRQFLADNLSVQVDAVNLGEVLDFHKVPQLGEPAEQMQRWQTLGAALRSELP